MSNITITANIDNSGYGNMFEDSGLDEAAVTNAVNHLTSVVRDAARDAIMASFPGCDLTLDIGYMPDKVTVCVAGHGCYRQEDDVRDEVEGIILEQCGRVCEPTINALCEAA